jgi:hypothetical protein
MEKPGDAVPDSAAERRRQPLDNVAIASEG